VEIVEAVGAVALHPIGEALALHVGGDAVEYEVADEIRREVQIAVARVIGELPIDVV
jgi:hypothetical protein